MHGIPFLLITYTVGLGYNEEEGASVFISSNIMYSLLEFKKPLVVEILLLPLIKGIKITWQLQIIIFGNGVNAKKLYFLKRIIF